VVALFNEAVPRTHGSAILHMDDIDFAVRVNQPLFAHEEGPAPAPGTDPLFDREKAITDTMGRLIADAFIDDGCTLQLGIGNIPDAVLAACSGRKSLGVHSELVSDGVMNLMLSGQVTNEHKPFGKGQTVTAFAAGSQKFYDFLHDNPAVAFHPVDITNDTAIIRRMPRMTAINSAIEVDLTGQVVSDSIGNRIFSGIGGQADFIRGAGLCPDGRPVIALPSRTLKGEKKITPFIKEGGGVVTTRGHVHYVVTEYGIADLFGQSLRERAKRLINIAHPDDRADLEKAAFTRGLLA
jgi:acyl-CoA hydrolase